MSTTVFEDKCNLRRISNQVIYDESQSIEFDHGFLRLGVDVRCIEFNDRIGFDSRPRRVGHVLLL